MLDKLAGGILSLITNHSYLDNPTFRGMRWSLMKSFNDAYVQDLHGNYKKAESCPDGTKNENVFDIQQGVCIGTFVKTLNRNHGVSPPSVYHADVWGKRAEIKYPLLLRETVQSMRHARLGLEEPFFFFKPLDAVNRKEYERGWPLNKAFTVNGNGIITAHDNFSIAFQDQELAERLDLFISNKLSDQEALRRLNIKENSMWSMATARSSLRNERQRDLFVDVLYRPFDVRRTFYSKAVVFNQRLPVMRHMFKTRNIALICSRMTKGEVFQHALVSTTISEAILLSSKTSNNAFSFPLYLYPNESSNQINFATKQNTRTNFDHQFITDFMQRLGFEFKTNRRGKKISNFSPEDVLDYIYCILHSPTYRSRYAEFLKIDFPRIPLTNHAELFRKLCAKGADLVALHLLEDGYEAASWNQQGMPSPLKHFMTQFTGNGVAEVAKGYPKYQEGSVLINPLRAFGGVPEEVWNFHIGGYQVCEKWLKDRRGRALSAADIKHYQRVIVALKETIRLMAEIDEVIDAHGGWPLPGSQDAPRVEKDQSTLPFA